MTASRPRDAAATRKAILQSAIENFARAGYDGVGVREIARNAGVTAMMVNRYFGSKEFLFAEAVEVSFAPPAIVADNSASIPRATASALVAQTDSTAEPLRPFLIMLRSVSNPRAVDIVRAAIERHVGRRLAKQLPEPAPQMRSEVVLAVISGLLLMRRVIATRALDDADPDELTGVLQAVFEAIIEAPIT